MQGDPLPNCLPDTFRTSTTIRKGQNGKAEPSRRRGRDPAHARVPRGQRRDRGHAPPPPPEKGPPGAPASGIGAGLRAVIGAIAGAGGYLLSKLW